MKYLKKINESKEELQNIAELCFVDLLDQKFIINTNYNSIKISYLLIGTEFYPVRVSFSYNNIKQYVEMCIDLLKRTYQSLIFKVQDCNGNILTMVSGSHRLNYPENEFKKTNRQKMTVNIPNNKSYYCSEIQLFKHIEIYSIVTFEINCYLI